MDPGNARFEPPFLSAGSFEPDFGPLADADLNFPATAGLARQLPFKSIS
jgi:hypothetical protein